MVWIAIGWSESYKMEHMIQVLTNKEQTEGKEKWPI